MFGKKKKPVREYKEIIDELHSLRDWEYKRARELHKELKHYGDGVPFHYRYEYWELYEMIGIMVLTIVAGIALALILHNIFLK